MVSGGGQSVFFWGKKEVFWGLPTPKTPNSPQFSEGDLEFQLLLGERLHLLDEVLEGRLQLVAHLPLHLGGTRGVKRPQN